LPPLGSSEHGLKADTFCKQVKKYFNTKIGAKEILSHEYWELLENFNIIRSNIAHSNGALEGLDDKKREQVAKAAVKAEGAKIDRDYLMLSQSCVTQWHEIISRSIKLFLNFYAKKYPGAEACGDNEI